MRDYLTIGSSPTEESCAQVGTPDYRERMLIETREFARMCEQAVEKQFGSVSIDIRRKSFPHDFGTYHEVVAYYDDDNEEQINQAYWLEDYCPSEWDERARETLGLEWLY